MNDTVSNKNTSGEPFAEDRFNTKELAKGVIIKDFVGSEDWKKSKLGYLSGASVIKRSVSSVSNTASESLGRLSSLSSSVFSRNYVEPTPNDGTEQERFQVSMQIHNRNEDDLLIIQNNTYKSALLYLCLAMVSLTIGFFSLFTIPSRDVIDILTRFIPLYIVCPLFLQHAYANWVVRTRRLGSIMSFIKSKNWMPKK